MLGSATTVTTVAELVPEQKLSSIDVTVYEPAVEAVIEDEFAPLFQKYTEPPLAVKTTLPPEHKSVDVEAVITGVGKELTVTAIGELGAETQPLTSVAITVYEPAVDAVYVDAVVPTGVDPFLQEYVEPPLAVKPTLPPEQKVVAPPAVIDAVGNGLTVMVIVVVVAQSPGVGVNV